MNDVASSAAAPVGVVTVHLFCVSCGGVTEIHVSPERGMPQNICWECLGCQTIDRDEAETDERHV